MVIARVFVPFAFAYFLSYLFRAVNAVIAPDLVADVGLDAGTLGLLTSAYFCTFAAFQVPLGLLLDRYGPKRTEAALLLIAAAGALYFAFAQTAAELIVARALIGLGVSACLMGGFKAYFVWFPGPKLPTINGIHLAVGAVGAMAATTPVEAALAFTDWRGLFIGLAVATFAAALLLQFAVPDRDGERAVVPFREQLAGMAEVYSSRAMWQILPFACATQATFLALQTLWAGPWLRDVAGLDRAAVADHLLLIGAAMVVAFVVMGWAAEKFEERGIPPIRVALGGMLAFIVVQVGLVLEWTEAALPLWMAFGFFGTSGIIIYPVLTRTFAPHLAGRVNTLINLVVFVGAFIGQWGVGAVIDLWPAAPDGRYAPAAYQVALAIALVLQLAGLAWLVVARRREPARA